MLPSVIMMISMWVATPARADGPFRFPETIELKTPDESFNDQRYYVVREGRIWTRASAASAEWELFGGWGLPYGGEDSGFLAPHAVIGISADGPRMVAVSSDRYVYYGDLDKLTWTDKLGLPFGKRIQLPEGVRSFALANMQGLFAYYVDINGRPHRTLGVNTIYVLYGDGRRIAFNDPWLTPNHFDHLITTPRRGEFVAESLSAGGSTMFVIDASGDMYTRLLDTDTVGADPFVRYGYEREKSHDQPLDWWSMVRAKLPFVFDSWALPNEDWRAQPRVPATLGRVTSRTTVVLLSGLGNSERELRVEGVSAGGEGGYFRKRIYDDTWLFVATGKPVAGPFLGEGAQVVEPVGRGSFDSTHAGVLRMRGGWHPHPRRRAHLEGFNWYFDPARIVIDGVKEPVTLHTHPSFYPIHEGEPATLWGALEIPEADEGAGVFCGKRFIEARVKITARGISVDNEYPLDCSVHFRFGREPVIDRPVH